MGILVKGIPAWRRTLPAITLIFGLMAVALSCGGSAEFADSAAAPAAMESAQPASDSGAQGPGRQATETTSMVMTEEAATMAPMAASAASAPTPALYDGPDSPFGAGATAGNDGSGGADGQSVAPQSGRAGRNLIVEAWLSLQVEAIDPIARQVETVAAQRGGWVETAEIVGEGGYRTASISVRVPSERFDETMAALRPLGIVTDEGIASQDVTEQLVDNESRMTAWRAQEERLIVLLENAVTVEDVVDIERRIAEVRTDIEYVAATQRNLQNRVAASLIRVNLHLPRRYAADPPTGQLALAVNDPAAAAAAVIARVATLDGYIGQKREYRQDSGDAVEISAFVRPGDLPGLMDYAANLGEITDRRLDSVGPSPVNDAPNARLTLTIRSNVSAAAALSLGAAAPVAAAEQVRARAESLGGYVETWDEHRREELDSVELSAVVKASDLRALMEYAAGLGETDNWEYRAAGQTPTDAIPNARLRLSVYTGDDGGPGDVDAAWLAAIAGAVVALLVAGAVAAAVIQIRRRRRISGLIRADEAEAGAGANASTGTPPVSAAASPASAAAGDADESR